MILKNLSRLDERPAALKEKVFSKLFEEAEIAKFTPTELKEYEDSLKAYRDIKNSLDTALEQGREQGRKEGWEEGYKEGQAEGLAKGLAKGMAKGREEGITDVAKKMLDAGMDIDTIVKMTGLSQNDIEKL